MLELASRPSGPRIAWVIPSVDAGGVGSVCRYAAEALANLGDWNVTLLSLHDPVEVPKLAGQFQLTCLGLSPDDAGDGFLNWLDGCPQDIVMSNDVAYLEPAFIELSSRTKHIIQVHDSGRRYRAVAVRNAAWTDGVLCVGKHMEKVLSRELQKVDYRGVLKSIHNGAVFPELSSKKLKSPCIRLLFIGRIDPIKGAWDLVKILTHLQRLGTEFTLTIAGGYSDNLECRFKFHRLQPFVKWVGVIPHHECYNLAAQNDVLLMLSRTEAFGMVTIETMAMGCVPIAYDTPSGTTEIVENGTSGLLVRLGDYAAVARAVDRLWKNPQTLASLSKNAVKRARGSFSADLMTERMSEFFRQVLSIERAGNAEFLTRKSNKLPPVVSGQTPIYQRLPYRLRMWLRNLLHSNPKLSLWLLTR